MKKLSKLFIAAVAVLGFSTDAFAQQTSTASATASATIITPISITKTADMNFGNIAVSSTTAGTVELSAAGSRTASGGVSLPATTGTVAAASFTVTGQGNYTYSITLPTTLTIDDNNSNEMTVDNFTSTPSTTGTLSSGTQTLTVGATLNVDAAQASGTYTSDSPFEVTVNYN